VSKKRQREVEKDPGKEVVSGKSYDQDYPSRFLIGGERGKEKKPEIMFLENAKEVL